MSTTAGPLFVAVATPDGYVGGMGCFDQPRQNVRHTRQTCLALAAVLLPPASASATQIDVVVSLTSGEVSLFNTGEAAAAVSFYQITSPSQSLTPSTWDPITGRLDAAGDGSFDAVGDWLVFAGSPAQLTEGVFSGIGGVLQPLQLLSLGLAWDVASPQDLAALLSVDETLQQSSVIYSPAGDFTRDGLVSIDDYLLFVSSFGSTDELLADGNGNGVVDSGDYTVWRDAWQPAPPQPAPGATAATPEPAGVMLATSAWLVLFIPRRR